MLLITAMNQDNSETDEMKKPVNLPLDMDELKEPIHTPSDKYEFFPCPQEQERQQRNATSALEQKAANPPSTAKTILQAFIAVGLGSYITYKAVQYFLN